MLQNDIVFTPIGIIHTPFNDTAGMPVQPVYAEGIRGTVELDDSLRDGLNGLDQFSHIVLLFHLHRSHGYNLSVVPHRQIAARGLFSTRSPRRPNPIGISVVRLDRVESCLLYVRDVDMLDGTPLLDIKPFIPDLDGPERKNLS